MSDAANHERLGDAGHPFEKQVPIAEQADEQAIDQRGLADENGSDGRAKPFNGIVKVGHSHLLSVATLGHVGRAREFTTEMTAEGTP